jgi:hypothetical protein
LILGLAVAPSSAGAWLAVGAVAAFLVRHPLKLVALDWRRGIRYPRTSLAVRFLAGYAATAALALAAALAQSRASILLPIALAAPCAFFALGRDLQGRGREALPEIFGAFALGSAATAIILAGDGASGTAWLAWALGAGRALTAILYVRARVRADRGASAEARSALARPVIAAHLAMLLMAIAAMGLGRLSPLVTAAAALLLLRAAHGLASGRAPIRPQILGVQEVLVGVACLGLFAAGLLSASGQ